MQLYDPQKLGSSGGGMFNAKEKKRLVLMIAGAVVIVTSIVWMQMQSARRDEARMAAATSQKQEELPTVVSVPKIDAAALEAAAADERPEQRVVLPSETLEAGFAQSGQVFDGVYAALGGRELSLQLASEIVQAPKEHRGRLLRARCFVDEMRHLQLSSEEQGGCHFVRGHLEDGAALFFAVRDFVGIAPVPGDFVRMDGLFVRVHRAEVDGNWLEAPLFVGPRMYESFPRLPPVKELDAQSLSFVQDDSVANGLAGLQGDAYWQLVSYVQHLEPGAVDWEKAPMLDDKTIMSIFTDGSAWRGKPVRVPVARMLGVWKQVQPENPLRLDHMIEGWFGRGDWVGQAKVARFVAPFEEVPPNVTKDVILRGFFYKNLAYEPKNGGVSVAPFFVVKSLEEFVPPDHMGLRQMTYIVTGSLGVLAIMIIVLLRRDRKSSEALEAELLRRRRERRQKLSPAART